MYASRLSPGREVAHAFGARRGGYLYLIDGALTANGKDMSRGDAAYVDGAGDLTLRAERESDLLLVDTPL
jgi:redox-sensitive bicupin YhaK (pirin superfamily)